MLILNPGCMPPVSPAREEKAVRQNVKTLRKVFLLSWQLVAGVAIAAGQTKGGAVMEQKPIWPAFEELQTQLMKWQKAHPKTMKVETLRQSAQGRPVCAVRLTDPEADEASKEHVLITALHSGVERSGTTTVTHLMRWLLSNDELAKQILKRQVIVCMPVVNPDGYVSGSGGNTLGKSPYTDWTLDGPSDPSAMPEAVAVQRVMDELQPEVHADIHGLDLSFPGYIMAESSGAAWSNLALRPYHHRIMELMDEAALAAGYPSCRLEQDAERLFWGPDLNPMSDKLWYGRPRPYAAIYCYNRYHSLILASEVCWEKSGVARHRRLLQVGNEVWPGEHYPGYPTRVIAGTELHNVVAYGPTAAQRRRSRVELWSKQRQIWIGFANPQTEGLVVCVCATSPQAVGKWLKDTSLTGFLQKLRENPDAGIPAVQRVLEKHPTGSGQWGDRAHLYFEGGGARPEESSPIEHGLSLRLRIPDPKARLQDLRLNGHPLASSETDGYLRWVAQGFTYVQVNVPPQTSRTQDLYVITCEYSPGVRRERRWR